MDSNRDATLHDSFHRAGYDQEEEYFYRQNRELIARNRQRLDALRQARLQDAERTAHWMHCPKCGGALAEIEAYGVMSERCTGCGGAFFDKAELELMMKTLPHEAHSFAARFKKLLDEATRPRPSGWHQIPV